jgi:hypothetical protein
MPSARNILHSDIGGMPNSYSMEAAPMKCCATIWEGSSVKIKIQISKSLPALACGGQGRQANVKSNLQTKIQNIFEI